MSKLVDPNICPDCRADLDGVTCTGCGLVLAGPLAARLWQAMSEADGLVESLRASSRVRVPAMAATAGTALRDLPPPSVAPVRPPAGPLPRRGRGLGAGSVPAILFGVGALCLLVAAIVFVAVAWSDLGLGARTTILLAVTGSFAAVAVRLTLKGLRGAAETFWLVVGALVTIDLSAAYGAGLLGFDELAARHAIAVIGTALVALGVGTALWSRRTELPALVAPAVTTASGALLLTGAEAWAAPRVALATTISVLVLAAAAAAAWRARLPMIAFPLTGLGVISWVVLLVVGLGRAADSTASTWWREGDGWPLIAAAALAAITGAVRHLPEGARIGGAGAAQVSLALLLVAPGASADTELVLLCAVAVVLALVSAFAPRIWSVPALVLTGLGAIPLTGFVLLRPLAVLDLLPTTGPPDSANLGLRIGDAQFELSPWTAILAAVVLAAPAFALTRALEDPATREPATRTWQVAAPVVVGLGLTTALLETGPTLAVAVAAWAAVLVALGLLVMVRRGAEPISLLVLAGILATGGLRLAVPSHLLVALLATGLALGLAAVCRLTHSAAGVRAAMAAMSVLAACFAGTHWPYLFGGHGDAAGLVLVLVAVAAGVLAAPLSRSEVERVAIEVVAFVAGLAAVGFPVDDGVATIVLTLAGTGVALVSVLHRDRDLVGWLGAAILGVAALLRIDADLAVPELTTAPAAALLLILGVRRLLTDGQVGSLRALGSGLTLALLPTLLLTLEDPVTIRSFLVGALALGALGLGIQRRWAAPFLAGAGTLAVLAVRNLGPVAEGLPRWISLGGVGVLLLAVAVTWESRRRELATAQHYLGSLR